MTCFSRECASPREGSWVVEIRSLNHRFFEFSLKAPHALNGLETPIKELVQAKMRRGKVTVAISQESEEKEKFRKVSINEKTVDFYLQQLNRLKRKYKLAGEMTVSDLFRIPGLFEEEKNEVVPEKIWPILKKTLNRALDSAIKAKLIEGKKLATDIHDRLEATGAAVEKIEAYTRGRTDRILKRLKERLTQLLDENFKDPERVAREVAFLAERSDITEELVRMKSHLELFRSKLSGTDEVGRELDFFCQEMNREVNTMTSKSQHFEISTEVVFIKGELEKIREQIQNIE